MHLRERFEAAIWTKPRRFSLGGAEFWLVGVGTKKNPTPPAFVVVKSLKVIDAYVKILDGEQVDRIFEIGVLMGGSSALFATLFEPERLTCVDICDPVAPLEWFRAEHPLGGRVRTHYQTSQDDEGRLAAICDDDFDGPLDLVIDDASHAYAASRASFEILFPRLRPGGWYVIEDWQWAHAPGFSLWRDQPALSNLIFQLLMVCGGRPDLVAKVEVFNGVVFVKKGEAPASVARLELERLYTTQSRTFTLI